MHEQSVRGAKVARLAPDRTHEAGDALARVVTNDPLVMALLPGVSLHTRRSLAVGGQHLLRFGLRFGQVYTAGDRMDAFTLWLPPASRWQHWLRNLWAYADLLTIGLPMADLWRMLTVGRALRRARQAAISGPCWELVLLERSPDSREEFSLSELLRPVLEQADVAGLPCHFASVQAHLVLEMIREGFETHDQGMLPGVNMQFWSMVRTPQ